MDVEDLGDDDPEVMAGMDALAVLRELEAIEERMISWAPSAALILLIGIPVALAVWFGWLLWKQAREAGLSPHNRKASRSRPESGQRAY